MKHTLTILTALLLTPLAALQAAGAPSLQPPQHLGPPKAEQAVSNRAFTGIPCRSRRVLERSVDR